MRENIWQLFCSHSASNILPLSFRAHEVGVSIQTNQKDWASVYHGSHACLYSFDFFFFFSFVERKCWFCQPGGVRKYPILILVLVVSSTNMPPHRAPSVRQSGQVRNRATDRCTNHIRRPEHGTLRRFRNLVVVRLPVSAFPPTLVFPKTEICSLFLLFLGLCNFFRPGIFRVVWLRVIHSARQISSPF